MKKLLTLIVTFVLVSNLVFAQKGKKSDAEPTDADKLKIEKSKVLSRMSGLALAQIRINYKLITTAKTIGQEKATGTMAGARVSAYLETTDGDLTEGDFQEITDYFFSYFQKKLKAGGIDTIGWNAIVATDFYKKASDDDEKEKELKDEKAGNTWVTSTAHKGNVLHSGMTAFAFGKIKRASSFCEEIGGAAAFFDLTLDFADVIVNIDIKTKGASNAGSGWYYPPVTTLKYTWAINPEMRVGSTDGKLTLFWNEKQQGEVIFQNKDIEGRVKYVDNMTEDTSKARSGLAKQFAFRKELTPVLIETTRDKYKAAAKTTLEKYADAFVVKCSQLQEEKKK